MSLDITEPPARQPRRRGSMLSDKQIAFAVRDSKIVTAYVEGNEVEGWIYGSDDYHWGVVTATGTTWLVHRSSTIRIDEYYYEIPKSVVALTDPFRDHVMKTYFHQQPPSE